jgi:hypothetical protein
MYEAGIDLRTVVVEFASAAQAIAILPAYEGTSVVLTMTTPNAF